MKLMIALLLSFTATYASAAEVCENYAKYFAIRDYKVRVGTVQGSDGIQYESELISTSGDEHTFKITIQDNNEDGDSWTVFYDVVVEGPLRNKKCTLVKLSATDLED